MELWKTIDGMGGVFSISNKRRIHQAEYSTVGNLFGKEVPVRQPEKYYDNLKNTVTINYKNLPYMIDIEEEMNKYFTKDEIKEGLESEFSKEVNSRGISLEVPRDVKVASIDDERWLGIKGFDGYEISDMGRVKRLANYNVDGTFYHEHIVKPNIQEGTNKVYVTVWTRVLGKVEKEVAKLVAEAFLPNPKHYLCVKHLNGDENDNRLENLQWYDNTPNYYIECKETGDIYSSMVEVCKLFNISPEELKRAMIKGDKIDNFTFIERKSKMHSSNGLITKSIIIKDEVRENVKVFTKRKYTRHENPIKPVKKEVEIKDEKVKTPIVLSSFKTEDKINKIWGERWKDIPDFKDYVVSSCGRVKRKAALVNGMLQKETIETPYEKNNLMWVKLINSTGVHEKIVERLVANSFLYKKDYFIITHKDNDFKNNNSSNLKMERDEDIQLNGITLKELSEKVNLSKFEIYTMILEGNKVYGEDYMIVEQEKKVVRPRTAIRCIETGKVFSSMTDAAKEIGVDQSCISRAIKKQIKVKHQYTFERISDVKEVKTVEEKEIKMEETIWKPYPQWEQYLQINKDGDVKSLERHVNNRVYPEKIHKPELRKNGDRKIHLTINGQSVYLDINQALKDTFGSVEIWKSCSVPKTLVSNHYNAKSIGRGKDKILTRSIDGKRLCAKRHINGKYYRVDLQKEVDSVFKEEERVIPKEFANLFRGEQLNMLDNSSMEQYTNAAKKAYEKLMEKGKEVGLVTTKENFAESKNIVSCITSLEKFLDTYKDFFSEKIKDELSNIINDLNKVQIPQGNVISDKDYSILNRFKELAREV